MMLSRRRMAADGLFRLCRKENLLKSYEAAFLGSDARLPRCGLRLQMTIHEMCFDTLTC